MTRIWGWLWKIYEGTQPDADGSLWNARKGVPLRIELRTAPIKNIKAGSLDITKISVGPILRTHSALGILKSLDEEPPAGRIVTREEYETIPRLPSTAKFIFEDADSDFAYLMPLHLAKIKSHTDTVIRDIVPPAQQIYQAEKDRTVVIWRALAYLVHCWRES